jgi:hypothetical protein
VPGHSVMSEQGVQEGTEHAPLRGPRVEDQHGECVVYLPLPPGGGMSFIHCCISLCRCPPVAS